MRVVCSDSEMSVIELTMTDGVGFEIDKVASYASLLVSWCGPGGF